MSMTHEEMIAVIQAHRDGKRIERILKSDCSPHKIWEELEPGHSDWSFATFRYRVKPEPREWVAGIYDHERGRGRLFHDEQEARVFGYGGKLIRVREVIE